MSYKYRILSKTVLSKDKFKIQKKWLHLFWIETWHSYDTLDDALEGRDSLIRAELFRKRTNWKREK